MKFFSSPYFFIITGGFTGAVLRFLIDEQIPSIAGTLLVNFTGCVFMGIFMYESVYIGAFSRNTRLFFGVGVIGAFTTFSALVVQSFQAGPVPGIASLLGSLLLGLVGILAGRHLISHQRGI
jgi:CrcB protein